MPVYVPPLRVLATQHWSIQQVLEGKPGSQQTSLCALTQAPVAFIFWQGSTHAYAARMDSQ
eukprot:1161260-Pelagomonas_calceolata.AAC.3